MTRYEVSGIDLTKVIHRCRDLLNFLNKRDLQFPLVITENICHKHLQQKDVRTRPISIAKSREPRQPNADSSNKLAVSAEQCHGYVSL